MSTPFADTKTIRAALFDVIDLRDCPWWFHANSSTGWTEDDANRERMRFVEQVVARISDLQSAPFDGVKLENLCPRHRQEALPKPTVQVCVQCAAEQKAKGQTG